MMNSDADTMTKVEACVRNMKERITERAIDLATDGFSIIFKVVKSAKGNHAQDVISPQCPASKYPENFGESVYRSAENIHVLFSSLNPLRQRRYIPMPPTKEWKTNKIRKALCIGRNKKRILGG